MPLLAGFDFGSTTSSFMLAEAALERNCVTGRRQFASPRLLFRSEPVFTPLDGESIDLAAVADLLADWRRALAGREEDLAAAGAIVTGLAARRNNAQGIRQLVRKDFGEAVVATADDPSLESWLAFMGGCGALSRFHAATPIINLDIGGGTTNPALGLNGEVRATGCAFIGARHFVFQPGGYRLQAVSSLGAALAAELGVKAVPGETLATAAVDKLLRWYVTGLEAICRGELGPFDSPAGSLHQQVAFAPDEVGAAEITFSGGVGELVYRLAQGEVIDAVTPYGDLGLDLARAILASPLLSRSLTRLVPEFQGRATVTGMALHGCEMSGNSLYLSRRLGLPLSDLPVLGTLSADGAESELRRLLSLAASGGQGGCLQITGCPPAAGAVKALALRLSEGLQAVGYPPERPLVLLTDANCGKTLGNYLSGWGRRALALAVIDEVAIRHARFVNLGTLRDGMVPVTYYGLFKLDA